MNSKRSQFFQFSGLRKNRRGQFFQFSGLRKNRRGQFYLLVAAIMITIIIGFSVISNTSKKADSVNLNYIKEELRIESENIMDYEINNNENKLRDFFSNYSKYIKKDIEFYFIKGSPGEGFEAYKYFNGIESPVSVTTGSGNIKINLNGNEYLFKILGGKNFYFIISKSIGGGEETYVTTN